MEQLPPPPVPFRPDLVTVEVPPRRRFPVWVFAVCVLLALSLGAVALGMGYSAAQRPVSKKRGRIAMVLGFAAILIGVFFYTLTIAMKR